MKVKTKVIHLILGAAKQNYQPLSFKNTRKQLAFLIAGLKYQTLITSLESRLERVGVQITNEMLDTIISPYIHNEWDVAVKLDRIATHYEVLSLNSPQLSTLKRSESLTICDFSSIFHNVKVKLDNGKWFFREGEMVINIFQSNLRVASIAFTLAKLDGETVIFVGAVQGIHEGVSSEKSLQIFKDLTKVFFGLRPRSMLLEALKVVARKLGAQMILGISEQNRHHRHQYFGNNQNTKFKNDYNAFWGEHGGELVGETGFYKVALTPAIREIATIAAKKRGKYRRRNEFVESIEKAVKFNVHKLP